MNKYFSWAIYVLLFFVGVLALIGLVSSSKSPRNDLTPSATPSGDVYFWFQWNGIKWVETGQAIFLTRDQIPYPNDEEHVGQCLIGREDLFRYPGSEALTAERICGRGSIPTPTPQPDKYLFLRFQKSVNESWFFTGKVVLSENFPEPNKDACYLNLAAFLKHPDISANDLATSLCN